MQFVMEKYNLKLDNYGDLYRWSIKSKENFWQAIWRYFDIKYKSASHNVLKQSEDMFKANWFSGAKLNFAENLMRFRDSHIALEFYNERGDTESLSYEDLYTQVAEFSAALKASGIVKGDRVAAVMPNIVQTVVAMLASTALGAICDA